MKSFIYQLLGNDEKTPLTSDDIAERMLYVVLFGPLVVGLPIIFIVSLFEPSAEERRAEEERVEVKRTRDSFEVARAYEREHEERKRKRTIWLSEPHTVADLVSNEVDSTEVYAICRDQLQHKYSTTEKVELISAMIKSDERTLEEELSEARDRVAGRRPKSDLFHLSSSRIQLYRKSIRDWNLLMDQVLVEESNYDRRERYQKMDHTLNRLSLPAITNENWRRRSIISIAS